MQAFSSGVSGATITIPFLRQANFAASKVCWWNFEIIYLTSESLTLQLAIDNGINLV